MPTTKEAYEKVAENQKHLMEILANNANELATLYTPSKELVEEGRKMFYEFLDEQRALVEEALKNEKGWMKLPDLYMKAMEKQTSYVQKSMEFWKKFWGKVAGELPQDKWTKANELYQDNWKKMMDTIKVNMESMNEIWSN